MTSVISDTLIVRVTYLLVTCHFIACCLCWWVIAKLWKVRKLERERIFSSVFLQRTEWMSEWPIEIVLWTSYETFMYEQTYRLGASFIAFSRQSIKKWDSIWFDGHWNRNFCLCRISSSWCAFMWAKIRYLLDCNRQWYNEINITVNCWLSSTQQQTQTWKLVFIMNAKTSWERSVAQNLVHSRQVEADVEM